MQIHTTVNLTAEIKRRLEDASRECGIPASALIAKVMKQVIKVRILPVRDGRCIQYQERAPKGGWRPLHVTLEGRDHEYFIDMRKLFKLSVSFLVVFSVKKYLSSVLRKMQNANYNEEADNYPFQSYAIIQKNIKRTICWKIYWGLPENPHQLLD